MNGTQQGTKQGVTYSMLDGLSLSEDECRRFFLLYLSWRKYVSFHIQTTSPLGNCGTVITIFSSYFYFGIYLFLPESEYVLPLDTQSAWQK